MKVPFLSALLLACLTVFANTGNPPDQNTGEAVESAQITIELTANDDENNFSTTTKLEGNTGFYLGSNSYFKGTFSENTNRYKLGLGLGGFARGGSNSQYLVGGNIMYSSDTRRYSADNKENLSMIEISPSYTYMPGPCAGKDPCQRQLFHPALRLQGDIGFGGYSYEFGGSVTEEDVFCIGASLQPGIVIDPCDDFMMTIFAPIFGWERTSYNNDNLPEPIVETEMRAGFNLGLNVGVYYNIGKK